MKTGFNFILIFTLSLLFLFASCREEEIEFIETPPENALAANSTIANLLQRTVTKDGSKDNIIDYANCFTIKLPVDVAANTVALNLNSENDYARVESIFDEEYDDIDDLIISFPITIIKSDFSEVVVNSMSELNTHAMNCNGENILDDDIECIDIMYPISTSIFNTNNELISSELFSNDNELYHFIENISTSDIISMDFPISVRLSDATEMETNSLQELETIIQNSQNDCDEDDDYDYNDDDCNTCTPELLANYLTNCPDWNVEKLKRDFIDYNDIYDGYDFNFFTDGTLSVYWSSITVYGTWATIGTGNNITLTINVLSLPLCNNNWHLQEIIETGNETKMDLRVDNDDRLKYINPCN